MNNKLFTESYTDSHEEFYDSKKEKRSFFDNFSITIGQKYLGISFSVKNNFIVSLFTGKKQSYFEYRILIKNKKLLKSKHTKHNDKLYKLALKQALQDPEFSEKYYE
tara:strand:- start:22570 stop:22890 length:321 start_codon:yes stop_codon:yes gene_type:complete